MDIYNYDSNTGEFVGAAAADANPLDPDNPIIPGYATPTAPPAVDGNTVAVYRGGSGAVPQNWRGGAWVTLPDYRRAPLYRTADGTLFALGDGYDGIGPLPDFLTDLPRPTPAHEWAAGEWKFSQVRADAIFAAAKQSAAAQIKDFIVEQRQLAGGTNDAGELQSRIAKRAMAEAVLAGSASETQLLNLTTEARLRGMDETAQTLAEKIVAKANALDIASAALDGLRRASENAIAATATQEELDACVQRFGTQIAAVVTDASSIQ